MILKLNYWKEYLRNISNSKTCPPIGWSLKATGRRVKNQKSISGFSIIEVVVVLLIISVGLIGVLALATQSITVSSLNKNELIASQLAQEGLELVRNQRDNNWILNYNWQYGDISLPGSDIYQDGFYAIDYVNGITDVDNIDNAKLKINATSDFYEHVSGNDTIFNRMISIINSTSEFMEIQSTVQWKEKGFTHDYVVSTYLYNWR